MMEGIFLANTLIPWYKNSLKRALKFQAWSLTNYRLCHWSYLTIFLCWRSYGAQLTSCILHHGTDLKAVSKEFSKTRLLITLFSTTSVYFWIIAAYLVSPRSAFFYFHVVSVFNWLTQKCRLCSKTLIRTATGTLSYIYQSQIGLGLIELPSA